MSDIILWALDRETGEVVHIDDVIKSEAREYLCMGCQLPVIARQGAINRFHFAHKSGVACENVGESILHRLVNKVLYERRKVMLRAGEVFVCVDVVREFWVDGLRVDSMLTGMDGERIAVEVVVTNALGDSKRERLRGKGYKVLVLDCTCLPRDMGWEEVVRWVTETAEDRELCPARATESVKESGGSWDWMNVAGVIAFIVGCILLIRAVVRRVMGWDKRSRRGGYRYA